MVTPSANLPIGKQRFFKLIILLATLGAAEALTRLLLPQPGFLPYPPEQPEGLLQPHAQREYAYTPHFAGEMKSGNYQVEIRTNALGLRDRLPERVDILAMGDSYTVGFGIAGKQAWPAQLQGILGDSLQVLNAGVSGYGLRQIRLLLEELLPILHPGQVIVGVYASRYWRIRSPYTYFHGMAVGKASLPGTRLTPGGLLTSPFRTPWLRDVDLWLDRYFYFGGHLLKSGISLRRYVVALRQSRTAPGPAVLKPLLTDLLQELELIRLVSDQSKADLSVLLVNPQEPDGRFSPTETAYNRIVEAYCRDAGIPCLSSLDLLQPLADGTPRFRLPGDQHWSAEAHALVAAGLADFLQKQKTPAGEVLSTGRRVSIE